MPSVCSFYTKHHPHQKLLSITFPHSFLQRWLRDLNLSFGPEPDDKIGVTQLNCLKESSTQHTSHQKNPSNLSGF